MKLRGRELYIIAAVLAVVLCAAWYFFFFKPVRADLASLDQQYSDKESELVAIQSDIQRLEALKKTAPQAEADVVKLRKLLPAETAVPSFIIELNQIAKASGLTWEEVTTGEVLLGTPWSLQVIDLAYTGGYFDLEDFLYRVENLVAYRNEKFLVSGRMFAVANMEIVLGEDMSGSDLEITLSMNGYMWTPDGTVPGVVVEE